MLRRVFHAGLIMPHRHTGKAVHRHTMATADPKFASGFLAVLVGIGQAEGHNATMHPGENSDKPGSCSKCKMDLELAK